MPATEMLCEVQSTLVLRGGEMEHHHHSFDAKSPIQMPEASRALPPAPLAAASHSSTPSVTPAEVRSQDPRASRLESTNVAGAIATRVKAWALALAHGHALPPPIITARDCALVAPLAWHCHQPRLATVDNQGRILIHNDPASAGVDGVKSPSVLRHSLHAGARALAWRPKAG
eukprot:CAMPEP_0181354304 /NCGR_PEP_ID=MMETSP1106-20121128/3290_1 /TAXON_ID=81844 /ORGANISM="Mantoniella antarctica, Strain SL-175" /LENGTH=172 /DNA_ID=CAMNT_0023466959 /DNA_START=142 /DNA_END=657 /DNA_ORIENTATION=+